MVAIHFEESTVVFSDQIQLFALCSAVEVEVELPPHSHFYLSQDGGPSLLLGKVVEEYAESVAARHIFTHLIHCIVCVEVGTDFACTHNLY